MDLARLAIDKRVVSALSTLLLLLAGYYAYMTLPRFEDPEFIIRQAKVITPYPGASAEEVADEITEVVENAIQELQGVKEITSISSIGLSIPAAFHSAAAASRLARGLTWSRPA